MQLEPLEDCQQVQYLAARQHASTTHTTPHNLLFHSSAFLAVTVPPVSLSVRLPAVVNGLTYWAGGRLLNPLAAHLTAPQVTVAAHDASLYSVSNWAENVYCSLRN